MKYFKNILLVSISVLFFGCVELLQETHKAPPILELKKLSSASKFMESGKSYMRLKEYDKAIEQFKEAIKTNPNNASAYIWLGRAYVATGQFEEASKAFDKARKLSPYETMETIDEVLSEDEKQKLMALASKSSTAEEFYSSTSTNKESDILFDTTAAKISQSIDYENPVVRDFAVSLAKQFPGSRTIGQICAIYDYLYKNWDYVGDPMGSDYFSPASKSIELGLAGDCDDFAITMAAVLQAIGFRARIVCAYGVEEAHAYAEVYLCEKGDKRIGMIQENIWNRYRKLNTIYGHITNNSYWLNLDWSSQYPGGPVFKATREIAYYSDGHYSILK
jgi:tetratricopeptide (TPR) repeat protein